MAGEVLSDESSFLSNISSESKQQQFSVVRDVMYKYSKAAQERFMAQIDLVFLFIWFQLHKNS